MIDRLTRRRMIAVSGAAAAPFVLAACGQAADEEERSEEADPELLNAVLAQHLAVEALAGGPGANGDPVIAGIAGAREASITMLEGFISEGDGEPTSDPAEQAQGESATEALILQLQDSIEVALDSVGDLSAPAYRQAVHRFITEDAASLAALRSGLGEDVAPDSFVFGPPVAEEEE
jgi:hypothetical protein